MMQAKAVDRDLDHLVKKLFPSFSSDSGASKNRIFGRCTASQIASASTASFFRRFTNGLT